MIIIIIMIIIIVRISIFILIMPSHSGDHIDIHNGNTVKLNVIPIVLVNVIHS